MLSKIKITRSESFTHKVHSVKQRSKTTKYRVPQRSPLSSVLFIFYVSNIPQPENVQTKTLSQRADDIALRAYGRTTTIS